MHNIFLNYASFHRPVILEQMHTSVVCSSRVKLTCSSSIGIIVAMLEIRQTRN